MGSEGNTEKRVARFTQVALVLGTLLVFVNPLMLGLLLRLDPDGVLYILTWDLALLVLLVLAVAFVRTKRNGLRKGFYVAAIASFFVLIGSEMFLSQWRIRRIDSWHPQTIEGVYEPHPELGWRPIPGGRGHHVSEGNFDATYDIDDLGRKEIPKSFETGPTLHFFGDSYTFGHGVSNEDTALNVLARGFARDRGYNVANYAVMAYGLEQMMTGLSLHRDQVEPGDYVIFVPTSFDLSRNMIHRRFLCSFPIRRNTPVGGLRMRAEGLWEIVDLDRDCGYVENLFLQSNFAFGFVYHSLRDWGLHPELLQNADAILAEAKQLASEEGAELFILFLAAPWECRKGSYDFDLSGLEAEHRSMLEHCPDEDLRFPGDSHWSPEGNRWVAEFLATQLDPVVTPKPVQ